MLYHLASHLSTVGEHQTILSLFLELAQADINIACLLNGRKRFDLLARFSFTSILTLFNGKWWNGPKRLDLIARFSFTSICSLFTSKWWNGQKVHESPPPLPQPGRRKQEMPSLNRVNIVLSIYSF